MNGQICISRVLDNEQQGIKQIFTKGNSATKNRIRMTMRSFVVLSVCLCLLLTLALLLFFDCFLSLRAISFLFCSCACNGFLDILIFTSLAKLYKLSRRNENRFSPNTLCALWPELSLLNQKINGFSCKYLGHGAYEAGREHREYQAGNQLQHEAIQPQIQLEEGLLILILKLETVKRDAENI